MSGAGLALARATLAAAALALALAAAPRAAAADAYVRVIAQDAPVYTGPGASYRDVYDAHRGEVFQVVERATRGYWFRVVLDDGTTGWIYGELVFPFEVVEGDHPGVFRRAGRAIRRAILGPPPSPRADVELSVSAGLLEHEGLFLFRPGWLVDPHFALEAFAGLSPRAQKDVFLAGLGWTLRLAPGAAIGPFAHAGVGVAHVRPKADNFVDPEQTLMALDAGGGFEITFKKQITLRFDYRRWVLFDPDQAEGGHELSAGLAIFF
ncbi:MAG TPA: SH3 domain-containing protein [Kofleriaceae bacterium]|nr:SH3 domain-containing protein [Kofleriaceae bacterium]